MRICLLTGGGYPYRRDALGGWCRALVTGLPSYTFDLLTVTGREPPAAPVHALPPNVTSARAVAFPAPARRATPAHRPCAHATVAAADLLCRALFGASDHADAMFADGLEHLAGLSGPEGGSPLDDVPLTELLLDAWQSGRAAPAVESPALPRLGQRDARTAATLMRHVTRALTVTAPNVDLVHCVGGTTPLLTALAAHWRDRTPLLITEAPAPVARRATEERLSPEVRTVLRRFRRAVARTGYAEAGLIAPVSAYHHGSAVRHGARPAQLVAVPAGVDRVVRSYDAIYTDLAGPAPGYELALAAPAPRYPLPPAAVFGRPPSRPGRLAQEER